MAKAKKEKSMEATLWDACDKLRGNVEPSEYKHVILSLIFLKYANDRFNEQREKMKNAGQASFLEMVQFYTKDNVFFVPENSRWEYLMKNAKQNDIALKIDTALHEIEIKNPTLSGALPDNYYSRLQIEPSVLASLLDKMSNLKLATSQNKDIFGRVYEYFLQKFAIKEGKGKGEFYTPQTVVALLCELIEPYKGSVYDGAMGSGGMFVQSMKFIEQHHGNRKNITVFGQESITTTLRLAKMNLAIRGISADLGKKATSTFLNDQHQDLKADFALMNPPFNQKGWRESNELVDDPRWSGYETPDVSNANYAWILNMVSKLSQNGVGCLLLANGALSSSGTDYDIRKQLIKNDLVEAIIILPMNMFYSTDISVTIWVFNKNKKARIEEKNGEKFEYRDRTGEILFMDLRQKGTPFEKKYIQFEEDERASIAKTYHNWQSVNKDTLYENIKGYCHAATPQDIIDNDYSLVTSKYIEFDKQTEDIDYDAEMKKIQIELKDLLQQEADSKKELLDVMEKLGYGI